MGRRKKGVGGAPAEKGRRLALAKGIRFTCRQCGDCCRDWPVALTEAEVERYEARDWSPIVGPRGAAGVSERARHGGRLGTYLKRRADGACIFLGEDDLCEVHRRHGEADKPLVCRSYPFQFVPGAERPAAGATFSCSAVAAGEGDALAQRRRALESLLEEVEAVEPSVAVSADVSLDGRRSLSREHADLLLDLLAAELEEADRPFPERLLAAVKLTSLVAGSSFSNLDRAKATKLLRTFAAGVHEQSARGILRAPVDPPPLPERLLFRQLLAMSARRDPATLLTAGAVRRGTRRVGNLLAGLAFLSGSGGFVPVGRDRRVNLSEVRRRAPAADPASPAADGALTRYLVAQLSSRRIMDPGFLVPELLPALGLLLRQYPAVLLFARAAAAARGGEAVEREDYASALRTVDWNFGRVPWTAGATGRVRARLLADVEVVFGHVAWAAGGVAAPPAPAAANQRGPAG